MKKSKTLRKSKAWCSQRDENASRWMQHGTTLLKSNGLKLTKPRLSMLEMVIHASGPFSAEDLHHKNKKNAKYETLDLVTIYRSLTTFVEANLLSPVDFGDGINRYELRGPDGHHHHYVICTKCKTAAPIDLCHGHDVDLFVTQQKSLEKKGFTQLQHRLEFFGICPKCNKS